MKTRKSVTETSFLPAVEWVRRLGRQTGSFEVKKAAKSEAVRADGRKVTWDYVITLATRPDNRRMKLFVETRPQLTPQTALAVFQRVGLVPPGGLLMVCAPYVSPRVAELCQEQGVAYLDGVGNCRMMAPGLFIFISGHPNQRRPIQAAVDPFSRKSSRIVRAVLSHPERAWQVQQLAREAGVSLGLVSKVKKALLEEAYLEERDRLLRVRDPEKLLRGWAAEYRPRVRRLQLFTLPRPPETETRLANWCRAHGLAYALTQLSAAWRYSPTVRYDKVVAYVDARVATDSSLGSLLGHLEAREVDTGVNCALWLTDDPAVFTDARDFGGVRVVSALQLYLDLKQLTGRGEDAAQELMHKELRPLLSFSPGDGEPHGGPHE
jgi:hypothetical protein